MTPAIDKRGIFLKKIFVPQREDEKNKKSEFTGDGRLPSPVLSYTEI